MKRISLGRGPTRTRLKPVYVPWKSDDGVKGGENHNPPSRTEAKQRDRGPSNANCPSGVQAEIPTTGTIVVDADRLEGQSPVDPEVRERLKPLMADEIADFHECVQARRTAGEGEAGIGWRALVDVRRKFGHWADEKW